MQRHPAAPAAAALCALLALAPAARAQAPAAASLAANAGAHGGRAAPVARVARATGAIHVDGKLDEAAWAAAEPVTSFTQYDPDEGKPASEATEARILYDDEALYVGVRLHDRGKVNTRLGRRDMDLGDSDWVGVVVDSYHDHLSAFSFDLNPSGVRRDETKTDAGDDNSWDAVWEGAASVDTGGWTAEYRIPFSQLRFNPGETTWGLQLERIIGRRNEYSVFAFTPKNERGGIARYGHLEGLTGVRTGKRLEVLPYTVARTQYVDPGANPFRTDHESNVSVGADLKYRVTSNLTLDATVNPDFGQVELDPASVNLTAFETVFTEKRPFFVEGSSIFSFGPGSLGAGGQVFYSRRIGGLTRGVGAPSPLADYPTETGILGAAKLTGKTPGGWSIGVLDALTGSEQVRYRDDQGDHTIQSEPLTNFFVGRLKKDLRGGRSFVGGMVTAANRDLATDALRSGLRSAGYTAGLDFRHEFAGRTWRLTGFAIASSVRGDSLAMLREQISVPYHYFGRPDAGHLSVDSTARALTGYSAELRLRKQAGAHWRGSLGVGTITPRFEMADVGSQRRGDRLDLDGSLTYLQQRPGRLFRSWYAETDVRREMNYAGEHIISQLFLAGGITTKNYWNVDANVGASPDALDDRLTRGGPIAGRPGNWRASMAVSTDQRKPLVGSANLYYQDDDAGGGDFSVGTGLQLKSSPRWNLSVGPSFDVYRSRAQYLGSIADATAQALYGRRYLFAELRQTTVVMDTRFNYTFSPTLSLQVYAQPFVAGIDFGDRTEYLVRPRAYEFAPDTLSGVTPADFNVRSLRGNAVLRWEWRQGSTMYLAWQQVRDSFLEGPDAGSFRFGRDQHALFAAAPDNVFVFKVSYWLNP